MVVDSVGMVVVDSGGVVVVDSSGLSVVGATVMSGIFAVVSLFEVSLVCAVLSVEGMPVEMFMSQETPNSNIKVSRRMETKDFIFNSFQYNLILYHHRGYLQALGCSIWTRVYQALA